MDQDQVKSLERRTGGRASFAFEVSPEQQYREWRNRVRGRVGAQLYRVPWSVARKAMGDERLRFLFDTHPDIEAAAMAIADSCNRIFEAPLC